MKCKAILLGTIVVPAVMLLAVNSAVQAQARAGRDEKSAEAWEKRAQAISETSIAHSEALLSAYEKASAYGENAPAKLRELLYDLVEKEPCLGYQVGSSPDDASYSKCLVEGLNPDLVALAQQGNADAQYQVGMLYRPLSVDWEIYWVRKAALPLYPPAITELANMYKRGAKGIPKNQRTAVDLYRVAAKQGYAEAQYQLGNLYIGDQDIPQDNVAAYAWWTLAAGQGHDDATSRREQLQREMSAAELSAAQELTGTILNDTLPGETQRVKDILAGGQSVTRKQAEKEEFNERN